MSTDSFKKYWLTTKYQTENATLEEFLKKYPISVGLDAEFKYPCYKKLNNTVPYCEKNKFVDTILDLIEKKC